MTFEEFLELTGGKIGYRAVSKQWIIEDIEFDNSEKFWELWRENKSEVKALGVSPSKNIETGKWCVKRFTQKTEDIAELKPEISAHCLSYQREHVLRLCNIIRAQNVVLDASDTGTGKTYAAILAAKQLGMRPFVICPLSVKKSWIDALEDCEVNDYFVTNYEKIRRGKGKLEEFYVVKQIGRKKSYEWKLPENSILIIDEAHKCANRKTLQGKMMLSADRQRLPMMLLSATACTSPLKMDAIAEALSLHQRSYVDQTNWLIEMGCYKEKFGGWTYDPTREEIKNLHLQLFPKHASRMCIRDIPEFPETKIIVDPIELTESETGTLNKIFAEIEKLQREMANLRGWQADEAKERGQILVQLLRLRQQAELIKCSYMFDMTQDAIDDGKHVALFVNFNDSLELLAGKLTQAGIKFGVIRGEQKPEERNQVIQDFRDDKLQAVICNISAGGIGISLHDVNGKFPRQSIISPTWDANQMKQALGRVHRAGGLTKSLQRIVFSANTVEERVAHQVKTKLDHLGQIQDLEKFVEDFKVL